MKITNKSIQQVSFDSLAKGDVFIYKGSVMMKIEPIKDWNCLTKVAICLDDGCATTKCTAQSQQWSPQSTQN